MNKKIKTLLVEDSKGDAVLIKEYLGNSEENIFDITHTTSLLDTIEKLNRSEFDLILLDLFLPDSKGFVTCMSLLDKFPDSLIIVLTGYDDKELGKWASKMGAQDFLFKNELTPESLHRSISYALRTRDLEKELEFLESDDLKKSERPETVLNGLLGTWELNLYDESMKWSEEVFDIFGLNTKTNPPALHKFLELLKPTSRQEFTRSINALRDQNIIFNKVLVLDGNEEFKVQTKGKLLDSEGVICSGTFKAIY